VYPEDVPPYYITENGHTNGFGIELLKKLQERLDLDIEYQPKKTRAEVLQALINGEAQIVPNTIKTDKRSEFLYYTESYNTSPVGVMTRTDKYDINSLEDIENHKLAYQANNVYLNKLSKVRNITFKKVTDGKDLLFELLSGKVDAIIYHITPTLKQAQKLGVHHKLKIIRPILYDSVRAIGVTKDQPELFHLLNEELLSYMKTSEYAALYKKWHSDDEVYWDKRKTYYIFTTFFVITVLTLIFWRFMSLKIKNNELNRATKALENSEQKFRALAGASNDIMIFCSPDYKEVFFVSDAYERLCGKSLDTFKQDPLSMRKCIHPSDRIKLIPQTLRLQELYSNSNVRLINSKTEAVNWVIIRDYTFCDDNNNENMIAVVMTDITDIVKAQEEHASKEAVMIQQAKYASMGEMIRAVSHQWKQPLNALYICTQLMEEEAMQKADSTMLDYIKTSSDLIEHMNATIKDFRSFFKQDIETEEFDAFNTVLETVRLVEPQMRSLNISYTITCSCHKQSYSSTNQVIERTHECPYVIKGKVNEFKHALINIIQNAKEELVKTDRSDKKINIRIECNSGFYLSIFDNGKGIDEKMLEKIFSQDITLKKDGTGLGLHLTKKIIESMNGRVWAENYNDGARFNITLPVIKKSLLS